ncbi:MAG: IS1595 family transposase [Candidatus Omnitrophica bacterium]|nr:IS1595 family transposase [Candidatus Omnitrophota bacterium]MDE2215532.1 IS1595 family transposase [Candidatus Omnitrophota bacterium]MDE2232491.1 IS1595 family transposase [Candidatus Omnitrophota bacterium]
MNYQRMKSIKILKQIHTEEEARQWVWKCRFGEKDFICPGCEGESYWQHKAKPEVRECDDCRKRLRVRAGTIFESSKLPLLTWIRALSLMMQGKRGISALELKGHLNISDHSAWLLLHKIREGLRQRDENYTLKGVIELDGAAFGKKAKENQAEVLVAVESKEWVDEKGRKKEKAGFAKVKVAAETKWESQEFVNQAMEKGSFVNTDASPALRELKGVEADYRVMANDPEALESWLPWVHRFISNAKAWIIGTHHGVDAKYLGRYLSEYAYRFNRRHDPDSLFHRALTACALAKPITARSLCA